MNIYAFFSLLSTLTTLFLGIWVYMKAPKEDLNKIFLILSLIGTWLAFAEFEFRMSESFETAYMWMKLGSLWPLVLALNLHFVLLFIERKKILLKKISWVILYLPAIFFTILDLSSKTIITTVEETYWGWKAVMAENIVVDVVFAVVFLVSLLLAYIPIRFYFTTSDILKKQQAFYISIGYVIHTIFIIITEIVFRIYEIDSPEMGNSIAVVSNAFIGYAVWKYKLFELSPTTVSGSLIETISDSILLIDNTGKIVYTNSAALKFFGLQQDDIMNHHITTIIQSHIADEMFQKKSIANLETVYSCHDNTKIPILLSSSHIVDSVGTMQGLVCVVHDISVQKEAEQKLQTIINTALSGIALSNLRGEFIYTNAVFPKLFGYTQDEFIKMTYSQLLPPDDSEDYNIRYNKLISGQIEYFHNIRRYQRKDESTFWGHVSVAVIRNIKGEPESIVTFLTDIDKLKRSEIEINKAHTAIQSSITYARRIQDAVLPSIELLKNNFSDCFILFKPRDVVSGDFYWVKRIHEYIIFAVADCTGHGVPGAFVSILGISLLNEIVIGNSFDSADQILNNLREKVKISLQQSRSNTEQKDGMDIALCIINTNTNELQFSGAYNPLYIFRNKEFIECRADRQPIGIFHREKPFTNHTFQLEKNDVLYTFSDGYIDQFGGVNGGKYLTKRFKKLLLSIQDKTMQEQQQILEQTFVEWKGKRKQIDDVLVMGVKV